MIRNSAKNVWSRPYNYNYSIWEGTPQTIIVKSYFDHLTPGSFFTTKDLIPHHRHFLAHYPQFLISIGPFCCRNLRVVGEKRAWMLGCDWFLGPLVCLAGHSLFCEEDGCRFAALPLRFLFCGRSAEFRSDTGSKVSSLWSISGGEFGLAWN